MSEPRRFPPWSVDETDACFMVRDANGQAVSYVYFEDEPGRRSSAKLLTRDEARRIAANVAKLPDLIKRPTGATDAASSPSVSARPRCEAMLHDYLEAGTPISPADVVAKAQAVLSEE
jgi:hypothetical protein